MADQEKKSEVVETFKIYYGAKFGSIYPLQLRRITIALMDEMLPKLDALNVFVTGLRNEVLGSEDDMKLTENTIKSLSLIRLINTSLMSKDEFNEYYTHLINIVSGVLDTDKGKCPPQIIECLTDDLNNDNAETLEFWKNQDVRELKAVVAYFRKRADLGKVQS